MNEIRHCLAVFTNIEYGDNTEWVRIVSFVDNDFCYHLTLRDHLKDAFLIGPDKLKKYTFDELREKQHLRITCDPEPKYDFELWACLFDCDPETISRKIIHNYYDEEKMIWGYAKIIIKDIKTGNDATDKNKPGIICFEYDDEHEAFFAGSFLSGVFHLVEYDAPYDKDIPDHFTELEKIINWEELSQF